MKNFNKDAVCPKCGSTTILSKYEEGYVINKDLEGPINIPETVRRICMCRYYWFERPLDYIEDSISK